MEDISQIKLQNPKLYKIKFLEKYVFIASYSQELIP